MLHFAIYSNRISTPNDAIILSGIRTLRHHFHIGIHPRDILLTINKIFPAVTAAICKRDFVIIIRSHASHWIAVIGSSFSIGELKTQILFANFVILNGWLFSESQYLTDQWFSHIEKLPSITHVSTYDYGQPVFRL